MSESKFPNSLSSFNHKPVIDDDVDNNDDDSDVITLNILNMQQNYRNEAVSTTNAGVATPSSTPSSSSSLSTGATVRPTTPTPFPKRLFSRKPEGLHLNISTRSTDKYQETSANCNSTPAATAGPPSSTTITTASSIFPYEENRTVKQINIGFDNIRYSTRLGFFRRGKKPISNSLGNISKNIAV